MQTARKRRCASPRQRMIATVHIQWKQVRPDLRHPSDESREERLAFITDALRLKEPLDTLSDLSDRQLGLVLDAFKSKQEQPQLPNSNAEKGAQAEPSRAWCAAYGKEVIKTDNGADYGAEIIHLASAEQVFTIAKLLEYLRWSDDSQKAFLRKRFRHDNPMMLRPKQAQALMRILFNIACARDLKARGAETVSRVMIREEIPKLKARLGIDRPRPVETVEEAE